MICSLIRNKKINSCYYKVIKFIKQIQWNYTNVRLFIRKRQQVSLFVILKVKARGQQGRERECHLKKNNQAFFLLGCGMRSGPRTSGSCGTLQHVLVMTVIYHKTSKRLQPVSTKEEVLFTVKREFGGKKKIRWIWINIRLIFSVIIVLAKLQVLQISVNCWASALTS